MKRAAALGLAVGLTVSACSGNSAGSGNLVPQAAGAGRSGASAPAGWATTSTQALTLANASDLGALDASKVLTIRVGLTMRNASQLDQAIAGHQTLSPAGFVAQYAPTSDQVASVESYLQSHGFKNISAEPNNLLISADGTVAQIQQAFNTKLESFSVGGVSTFANVSGAFVPQSLGNIVLGVLGLNNLKLTSKPIVHAACSTPCINGFTPRDFWHAYDVGPTPLATNSTMAVMAEGNVTQVVSDLRSFESAFGLPQVPVTVQQVGLPSPDTAGATEWDLDTQSSTGIAGNVKMLYIYDTTSMTDSDIVNEYSHWATDDLAQAGNSSFGECEYSPNLDGAMAIGDEILKEAAAQGQTMFASAGDTGSSCGVAPTNGVPGSGPPMVSWPASSSWVVAVGGTTLAVNADGSYAGELAWNAGGGGLSQFESMPAWQAGVMPNATVATTANDRGVPDIAMDADATTGAQVYNGGSLSAIGGTSLSSPLAMGSYTRLQSAHNNALGYAPPRLYAIYAQNPTAGAAQTGPPPTEMRGGFHDILTGANGTYTALPGYDFTTGLGTFDIAVTNGLIGH